MQKIPMTRTAIVNTKEERMLSTKNLVSVKLSVLWHDIKWNIYIHSIFPPYVCNGNMWYLMQCSITHVKPDNEL